MLQKFIGIVVLLAVMAGCTNNSALPQEGGQAPLSLGAVTTDQSSTSPATQEASSLPNPSHSGDSAAPQAQAPSSSSGLSGAAVLADDLHVAH
mgnify:CR=1 FL=1